MHQLGPRAELLRHLERLAYGMTRPGSTGTWSKTAEPLTVARWPITFQSSSTVHARGVPLDERQDQAVRRRPAR